MVRATLVAPEPLLKERSFLRLHNRSAKESLREQGLHHWKVRIPQHFTRSAHQRYGYMPRVPRYMRIKARRWRSVTDLVKTGRMRDEMTKTPPVIRVGGKAADDDGNTGALKLSLTMPFHVGQKAQQSYADRALARRSMRIRRMAGLRTGVTIAQMRREVATIREDEGKDTARRFLKGYGTHLGRGLAKAPRIRKRVTAAR
jgi:hypothetical protein